MNFFKKFLFCPVVNGCIKNTLFRNNINIKCHISTRINVNEYLLNRTKSPTEILNNLEEEDEKELMNIKLSHELLISEGSLVPKILTDENYLELLCLSERQRGRYFEFLFKKEKMREKDKMIKMEKNRLKPEVNEIAISPNRFITKFTNTLVDDLVVHKMFHNAILQPQNLVFDASFEDAMTRFEVKNLSKQFLNCYHLNRVMDEPFQMVLTNLHRSSIFYYDLSKVFTINNKDCRYNSLNELPISIEERDYKEIFPDRRLIYLSPDSHNPFEMGEYDHDAVYICGAIVDKGPKIPLTLAKARRDNIEHRSFPIDRYVRIIAGQKSLTLTAVMTALRIARDTNGDWKKAIEAAIPSRFVVERKYKRGSRGINGGSDGRTFIPV